MAGVQVGMGVGSVGTWEERGAERMGCALLHVDIVLLEEMIDNS